MTDFIIRRSACSLHGFNRPLLIGLLCLALAGGSACMGFQNRAGSDFLLEKGFKTEKWAPLVQIDDSEWLLFAFRVSGSRTLNDLLQNLAESNGCTALSNIEVRSEVRLWLLLFQKKTFVYARCVGGKKVARPKPKAKEEAAEEEAYEE